MMSGPSTSHRPPPRVLLWLQDGVEADLLALQLRQAGLVVVAARSAEHVRNALSWASADAFIVEVPSTRTAEAIAFLKAQRTPSMALYAVTPPGGLDRATELKLFALGCRDLWAAPLSAVAIAQQLLSGPAGATPTSESKDIKGLAGNFRYQPLTYVFQMCRRHRLNARLHARLGDTDDDWAVLLLKGGEIVDAETPGLRGKAAAVEWLARAGHGFILHPLAPDAPELQRPDVIQEDIARLLMRAQHRRGGSPPPAVAALPVAQVPQALAATAATDDDHPRPGGGPGGGPKGAPNNDGKDDGTDATQILPTQSKAASRSGDGARRDAAPPSSSGRREGTAPGLGAPVSRRAAGPRPGAGGAPEAASAEDALPDDAPTTATARPGPPGVTDDPDVVDDRAEAGPAQGESAAAGNAAKGDGGAGARRKETADGIPGAAPSGGGRAGVKRGPRRGKREGERTDETPRDARESQAAQEARQAFRRGPRRGTAPGGPRGGDLDSGPGRQHGAEGPPRLSQAALDALQEAESTEMVAPAASARRPPRHGADLAATLERRGPLEANARAAEGASRGADGEDERGGVWVNPRSGLIHVGKVRAQPEAAFVPPGAEEPSDRPKVKVRHMRQVDGSSPPSSSRAKRPSPPSSGPSTRPGARPAPPPTTPSEGTDGGFEAPRFTPHPLGIAGWVALAGSAIAIAFLLTREAPEPPPPSALSVASERFAAGDRQGVQAALMPRFRAGEASSVELRLLADAMLASARPHTEVRPVIEALVALSPSDVGATAWLAALSRAAGDEAAFGRHLERAEFLAPGDAGVQSLRASAR